MTAPMKVDDFPMDVRHAAGDIVRDAHDVLMTEGCSASGARLFFTEEELAANPYRAEFMKPCTWDAIADALNAAEVPMPRVTPGYEAFYGDLTRWDWSIASSALTERLLDVPPVARCVTVAMRIDTFDGVDHGYVWHDSPGTTADDVFDVLANTEKHLRGDS